MKKFLLAVGCGLGVIAGGLLIWHVVLPILSNIFTWGGSLITGLF